jgi:hypothetical protein
MDQKISGRIALIIYAIRLIILNLKHIYLIILLVVFCCGTTKGKRDYNPEIFCQKEIDLFYNKHQNSFLGHGIGCHKNQNDARIIADNKALGCLAESIRVKILSVTEDFRSESSNQGLVEEFEYFVKTIIQGSDVWLPHNIKPKEHKEWQDNRGLYHILTFVKIDREKYFNYLEKRPYNNKPIRIKEIIEELKSLLIE